MKSGNFNQQRDFLLAPDKPYTNPNDTNNTVIKRKPSMSSVDGDAKETEEEKEKEKEGEKDGKRASVSFAVADDKIAKPPQEKKKLPVWLTSFADRVLGEAQAGLNIAEADDATAFLLGNRPPFDNDIEVSKHCVCAVLHEMNEQEHYDSYYVQIVYCFSSIYSLF